MISMNSENTSNKALCYIRDSLMTVLFALLVALSIFELRYVSLACAGVLALYLFLCHVTNEPIWPKGVSKFTLVILIALGALTHITTVIHSFWAELLLDYIYFTVNMIVPITIAAFFMARPSTLTVFIRQLKALSWILIVYAFYESATRTNYFGPYYDEADYWQLLQYDRALSVFKHPIVCAFFFSFMFCAGLYVQYRFKIITMIYEVLMFAGVIITRARTSLVALAAVGFFWFINTIIKSIRNRKDKTELQAAGDEDASEAKKKSTAAKVAPYIVVILGLGAAYYFFADRIRQFVGEYYERIVIGFTGQDQGVRIEVLQNAYKYFFEIPWRYRLFGAGSRVADVIFMKEHPALGWWSTTTDNMYITLFIDEGLAGLGLFLLLIFFAVVVLFMNKSHMQQTEGALKRSQWAEWGAYLVIYTAVSMFFFEGLYWAVVCFLFMISLFMIRPLKREKESVQGEEEEK